MNPDSKKKPGELIKFFFGFQRKYLSLAAGAGVLLLVNVALQLPMPLVTRYLIDVIIPARDFMALNILCLALLAIIIFRQLSNYFMRFLLAKYKARVRYDLELALYLHVQSLSMHYFTANSSGYILSRISEASSIESTLADTFLFILKDSLTILVGTVLILSLHFELGVISLALLPFFIYALKFFHLKIKAINKQLREAGAQYYGKVERNITSIEKIKSSVKEDIEGRRLSGKLTGVIQLGFKSEMINALASTITAFIGIIAPFIVLWYGIFSIMKGTLTLGTFFAINSFLGYLYKPAKSLTSTGYSISGAMAGLERILEIFKMDTEPSGDEIVGKIDNIMFNNVGFGYDSEEEVLKNIDLEFKTGEPVALVGESGQGKSTLVKLILKYYQPRTGSILFSGFNGIDLKNDKLREKIAYVSQNPYLLEDEIEEKLKHPVFSDWIKKFRLDKTIKPNLDNGSIENNTPKQKEFSGGEVQKLEIIDALLKNADVLIIDEGTSHIDFNAEKIVMSELFNKYEDKIIIFIAHRLTSVTVFQRIIVIDKGRIVEQGTHEELMEKKGKYFFLWGKQKHQS